MNKEQFEELSSNLLLAQGKVRDEDSLLITACALLGASVGLLIQRNQREGRLVKTYPVDQFEWAREHVSDLRAWYGNSTLRAQSEGYAIEGYVEIGGLRFGGALVAFSGITPRAEPAVLEILLLQEEGSREPYRSYHLWAAASLLRHFEHIQGIRFLEQEKIFAEQYSRSLAYEALRDEHWERFVRRIGWGISSPKPVKPDFLWLQGVIWTAYRVRDKAAGRTASAEDPGTAFRWLLEEEICEVEGSIYHTAIRFLLSRVELEAEESSALLAVISQYLLEPEGPAKLALKAVVLVLEHAWREVRRVSSRSESGGSSSFSPLIPGRGQDSLRRLLEMSLRLATAWLQDPVRSAVEDPATGLAGRIGREELRLYFSTLLLQSPNLREFYLGLYDNDCPEEQPAQVKITFLLNLSRFMLDVVSQLQGPLGIDCEPKAVSAVEVLDSLLYLVDRYIHVELRVDERLHLRETLGRNLPAEVEHYLSSRFYRDHLLHVIEVFLLGHVLLHSQLTWFDGYRPLVDQFALLIKEDPQKRSRTAWLRQWAVAALFHDIGYGLGWGEAAARDKKIWRMFFSLQGGRWNALSQPSRKKPHDRREFVKQLIEELKETHKTEGWMPECTESELDDHGVLSALRIAQVLCHAELGDSRAETSKGEALGEYRYALHAMAHHDLFNREVHLATHPLSCLLRICDELQEWGRRRVNIERMVKQLYLNIQDDEPGKYGAHESLKHFEANLRFEALGKDDPAGALAIHVLGKEPRLCFLLCYKDPLKAGFEAILTFLSKAYNLQHLNLAMLDGKGDQLRVDIELRFPCPPEYRGLTEYDIYGLFRDQARALPVLPRYASITQAMPGLGRIDDDSSLGWDRICIVLRGEARSRAAWLPLNPFYYFKEFVEFKERVLNSRSRLSPS